MTQRSFHPSFIAILLVMVLLTACSAINPPRNPTPSAPTPVPPPSETPLPVVTDTPAPTATVTPTATPDASGLAASLGLPSGHTYSYDSVENQTVLVDGSNQARRAVLEKGQWRKLDYSKPADAELMYGSLVPKQDTYLEPKERLSNVDGALYHFYQIKGIYLGDVETGTVTYKSNQLSVPYLLVGLRSQDGVLHVLRFGSDSPDLLPEHYRTLSCTDTDGNDRIVVLSEDMTGVLRGLKVGGRMKIEVLVSNQGFFPGVPKLYQSVNTKLDNNYAALFTIATIRSKPAEQITEEEAKGIASGKWPERTITVYNIQPHTFEYADCK